MKNRTTKMTQDELPIPNELLSEILELVWHSYRDGDSENLAYKQPNNGQKIWREFGSLSLVRRLWFPIIQSLLLSDISFVCHGPDNDDLQRIADRLALCSQFLHQNPERRSWIRRITCIDVPLHFPILQRPPTPLDALIGLCTMLRELFIDGKTLKPVLPLLPNLQRLQIHGPCGQSILQVVPRLLEFGELRHLDVEDITFPSSTLNFGDFPQFSVFKFFSLRSYVPSTEGQPDIAHQQKEPLHNFLFPSLKCLTTFDWDEQMFAYIPDAITFLQTFSNSITHMTVHGVQKLSKVPFLPNLRSLGLIGCQNAKLQEVVPLLHSSTQLEHLHLSSLQISADEPEHNSSFSLHSLSLINFDPTLNSSSKVDAYFKGCLSERLDFISLRSPGLAFDFIPKSHVRAMILDGNVPLDEQKSLIRASPKLQRLQLVPQATVDPSLLQLYSETDIAHLALAWHGLAESSHAYFAVQKLATLLHDGGFKALRLLEIFRPSFSTFEVQSAASRARFLNAGVKVRILDVGERNETWTPSVLNSPISF
ncbi:hypothetical protein BT69DRAFT_1354132 [Atractiella rhizophila]|nr:hypothetical protein BT69DRAFT_1354132 [Atractiella rhizophila]